jgi:hypothetical protein
MLSIQTFAAAGAETTGVLDEIGRQIAGERATGHFVYAFFGCDHNAAAIHTFLCQRFPGAAFIGGTSGLGIMTEARMWGKDAIGLLLIDDEDGLYGAAVEPIGDDPAAAAEKALRRALAEATCPGELPALVWVYQAPGREEETMDGMRRVIGDACPIVGGSSADDNASGRWRQIAPQGVFENAIAVAVLFPSGSVGTAFQGGFEPAGPSGIVTRIGNDRGNSHRGHEILEIDGRPAALVYDEWSGGRLGEKATHGGFIFEETTMFPLAAETGENAEVPQFLLIHPKAVTPHGSVTTFAAVALGSRIHIMRGHRERLAGRAGRVAGMAAVQIPGGADSLAGGVMVFCNGCRRAIGDAMADAAGDVSRHFHSRPMIACFTIGEQGCINGRNAHGNLMISAVAFGN